MLKCEMAGSTPSSPHSLSPHTEYRCPTAAQGSSGGVGWTTPPLQVPWECRRGSHALPAWQQPVTRTGLDLDGETQLHSACGMQTLVQNEGGRRRRQPRTRMNSSFRNSGMSASGKVLTTRNSVVMMSIALYPMSQISCMHESPPRLLLWAEKRRVQNSPPNGLWL